MVSRVLGSRGSPEFTEKTFLKQGLINFRASLIYTEDLNNCYPEKASLMNRGKILCLGL